MKALARYGVFCHPFRMIYSMFLMLLVNPYPVVAALLLAILMGYLKTGMNVHIGETGWYLHDVLFYGGCAALLFVLFILAVGNIVLICIAGCRKNDEAFRKNNQFV